MIFLLETLELVGNEQQDEAPSPRIELLLSLQQLASITTEDKATTHNENESSLVDREVFLENLRQQATHYFSIEVPRLQATLLNLLQMHPLSPTTSLVYALVSCACSRYLPRERDLVEQVILHLDNFYDIAGGTHSSPKSPSPIVPLISRAIASLRRVELAAHPNVVLSLGLFTPKASCRDAPRVLSPDPTPPQHRSSQQLIPACEGAIHSATPIEAVQSFLEDYVSQRSVTTIGLVGAEGKTYNCQRILAMAVQVVQLRVPLDLLGSTRGHAETIILRKFQQLTELERGVLIVDDIHQLTTVQLDCVSRSIEWAKTHSANSCLVILTCPEESILQHRIVLDRLFRLGLPDAEQRAHLLSTIWSRPVPPDVVEATAGKSYAELQQLCRQTVLEPSGGTLASFRRRLSIATPESLKKGLVDDSLDWQVWGANELETNSIGPLQGQSVSVAWNRLQTNLLIPLTRSTELATILGIPNGQTMSLGALITGSSGSGKTSLARQCARFAKCPLLTVSCPTLLRQTVGGSEKTLCRLLLAARQASPCILLLEHLEAVAAVRGNDTTVEGTMDRLLSTLLVELDGLENKSRGTVAVIGTTVSDEWIDPSLLRPGRLELVVNLERDWE